MTDTLRIPGQTHRPVSSLSNRPLSRASLRSLSQFSVTKQPRLVSSLRTLIKQVLDTDDHDKLQYVLDAAVNRIDSIKQASAVDILQVDTQVAGHIMKAKINVQNSLAKLLQQTYQTLKRNMSDRKDLDTEITFNTLPAHIQFLLLLSNPPTAEMIQLAEKFMDRKPLQIISDLDIWRGILQEEPLQGEHWQDLYDCDSEASSLMDDWSVEHEEYGTFLPSESPRYINGSSPPSCNDFRTLPPRDVLLDLSSESHTSYSDSKVLEGRKIVETLYGRQYWRLSWKPDFPPCQSFELGDPSTLGPTLDRLFDVEFAPSNKIYLNEIDIIRDILMRLQGHRSCLFDVGKNGTLIQMLENRRIPHLTYASQKSLLGWFAVRISTIDSLRHLVKNGFHNHLTKTSEAFIVAVSQQLHQFDRWCSSLEENICNAYGGSTNSMLVFSLLSLKYHVEKSMSGAYDELLKIFQRTEDIAGHKSSSVICATILNSLWYSIQKVLKLNDIKTANMLLDVWKITGEPTWLNLEYWLRDGMAVFTGYEDGQPPAVTTWDNDEFFIRVNPLISSYSPDSWEASYSLPPEEVALSNEDTDSNPTFYPCFLKSLARDILAAGKAVGLLRALGMLKVNEKGWLQDWKTLKEATASLSLQALDRTLSDSISEILLPPCKHVQGMLRTVLVNKCEFWRHLHSLEHICLMTRGDALSAFCEKLFSRMEAHVPWNDFHFMNTAFRQISTFGQVSWINSSSVRFGYRGPKDRNPKRTVRAIDGVIVEYSVPFPLTYLFGSEIIAGYSSIFVFLLQIRRAKSVLDRISLRSLNVLRSVIGTMDTRAFFAIRNRLVWFVNTIWNFMTMNVIQVCLIEFYKALEEASSLDEMIACHHSHLEKLLGRCLLQSKTASLHRAILSVFDLCLQFNESLFGFATENSMNISHRSFESTRRKHPRQHFRRKSYPAGLTDVLLESNSDTDDEEDKDDADEGGHDNVLPSANGSYSLSDDTDTFSVRLSRISNEVNGLVRFVSRGVDSLIAGTGESSSVFGALGFSFEGW